jgi:hypothetical protein
MAGGTGDGNAPGDTELDTDLGGVDPDEEQEVEGDDSSDEGGEAGGADGDGGDASEEPDDEERPQRQARDVAPPRREGRYQRLANENRELKNRVTEFERTLQTVVAERRQPSAAELAAEAERERQAFELMTPYEQHQYTLNKTVTGLRAEYQRDRAAMFEQNDKEKFEAKLQADPRLSRYRDTVEDLKKQAPGVDRQTLLEVAVGRAALNGVGRARNRQTKAADEARTRQTARPSNGRGDVRSDRGRGNGAGSGSFEHLRNVSI